jgi:hypothetical protein
MIVKHIRLTKSVRTFMYDEKDPAVQGRRQRSLSKVIPLFKESGKATIKQSLSEIHNAIYLLNLATDLDDIGMQDSEIDDLEDELYRDFILGLKEIRGYAEKASSVLFDLANKHRLNG